MKLCTVIVVLLNPFTLVIAGRSPLPPKSCGGKVHCFYLSSDLKGSQVVSLNRSPDTTAPDPGAGKYYRAILVDKISSAEKFYLSPADGTTLIADSIGFTAQLEGGPVSGSLGARTVGFPDPSNPRNTNLSPISCAIVKIKGTQQLHCKVKGAKYFYNCDSFRHPGTERVVGLNPAGTGPQCDSTPIILYVRHSLPQ